MSAKLQRVTPPEVQRERVRAFLARCFAKSQSEYGAPCRWRLLTEGRGGVTLDSDALSGEGPLEQRLSDAAAAVHEACEAHAEGRREECRLTLSVDFEPVEMGGAEGASLSLQLCYAPLAAEVEGASDAFVRQMRGVEQLQRSLLLGVQESQATLLQLSNMMMQSLEHRERCMTDLVAKLVSRESEDAALEVKMARIDAEVQKFDRVAALVAPHLGELVDGVKGLLPGGKRSEGEEGDAAPPADAAAQLKARIEAFAKALTAEQQATAVTAFGLTPLLGLQQGDIAGFVRAVKDEQVKAFGQALETEQRREFAAILKAAKQRTGPRAA